MSLSEPSLVERTFSLLHANHGDLARPVVLVVDGVANQPLESCDAVQAILNGSDPGYVVANYVTINSSTGVIQRWQLLALSPSNQCSIDLPEGSEQCPPEWPLCSSVGACAKLFDGSRQGLRSALAHVYGALSPDTRDSGLHAAAVVETSRTSDGAYVCTNVIASTRHFGEAVHRSGVDVSEHAQTPAESSSSNQNANDSESDDASSDDDESASSASDNAETRSSATTSLSPKCCAALRAEKVQNARAKHEREKQVLIGLAVGLVIILVITIIVAATNSASKKRQKEALEAHQKQTGALYRDMVEQRVADRAALSLVGSTLGAPRDRSVDV